MNEVNARLLPKQLKKQDNIPSYQIYSLETKSAQRRAFVKAIAKKATAKALLPKGVTEIAPH